MEFFTLECPHCGAELHVEDNLNTFFCMHCGKKVILDDKEILQAKLHLEDLKHKERIQDKKMMEKERRAKREQKSWIGYAAVMFGMFALMIGVGVYGDKREERLMMSGLLEVPNAEAFLSGDNYEDVANQFEDKGFTNIECIQMNEKGLLKKSGDIDRITIDGNDSFTQGDYFDPDSKVKIYYYP